MRLNNKITISELSRLINISRPSLYKYISDYENELKTNIPNKIIELIDFILSDSTIFKEQIYEYTKSIFETKDDDKTIIDKLKLIIKDDVKKEKVIFLIDNIDLIDLEDLEYIVEEELDEEEDIDQDANYNQESKISKNKFLKKIFG
ncbi:MAG: hypothetical protein ACRC5M_04235 [Anaeroplasmataceae bacterium]